MGLAPDTQMYLNIFREQDPANKIPYAEWPRDAKDHITGRGSKGRIPVELMKWAETTKDTTPT